MKASNESKTVAIIGGGVSGTLTALHLIRQNVRAEVVLIDQRPNFGLGLAYSTPSLRHLLNVPAGKISALPDQSSHFLHWLRANYDRQATENTFAPRAVFGRYIQSLLAATSGVRQKVASVIDIQPEANGATVILEDGRTIHAHLVVLATGNFDPAPLPGIAPEAIAKQIYFHNAWARETYQDLPAEAPIAIIGSGLTGVDVVLRLRELGHKGKIIAFSRHGILPNRHAEYTPLGFSAVSFDTPATALAYLRALRATIKAGAEWRAAIDSVRDTTNALWLRLPLAEQKRFRRHLQRRWDVVRHRMAPTIADLIEAELKSKTLDVHEGHLESVDSTASGAVVTLRTQDGIETFQVNRVINCTGPSMNYRRVNSPLLQRLFDRGIATAGPLGAGFHGAENGALIDTNGHASEVFFNLGPGRLGNLLESIAVPEIRHQAIELAETLAKLLLLTEAHQSVPSRTTQTTGNQVAA